jgi:hypothetical protein
MDEEDFSGFDTQCAKVRGEGVPGDKWAGGRGCGHGPAVSPKGAWEASD